jgi:hypothetical protein
MIFAVPLELLTPEDRDTLTDVYELPEGWFA